MFCVRDYDIARSQEFLYTLEKHPVYIPLCYIHCDARPFQNGGSWSNTHFGLVSQKEEDLVIHWHTFLLRPPGSPPQSAQTRAIESGNMPLSKSARVPSMGSCCNLVLLASPPILRT